MPTDTKSSERLFADVEKAAEGIGSRASWRGVLSLKVPSLLGESAESIEFHVRAAKAKGDQKPLQIKDIDKTTGREVVSREVDHYYRYREGPSGERLNIQRVPYEEAKERIRYLADPEDPGDWFVSARHEAAFFDKDALEQNNKWIEIPESNIVHVEEGDEVNLFGRTETIEIEEKEAQISLQRVAEYKMKEIYQINADTDKKVKEQPSRIRTLARKMLERNVAYAAFFSWGRGRKFYTSVLYPYEISNGRLWLLLGMSEGILQLDPAWSIQEVTSEQAVENLVVATQPKRKPRVQISK